MANKHAKIIIIPARIAASRLPNKPLVDIAGKPMIQHVWERAMGADIAPVYVATDDRSIADVIEQAGGKAVLTRVDHPSGSDRVFEAIEKIDPQQLRDIWAFKKILDSRIYCQIQAYSLFIEYASQESANQLVTYLLKEDSENVWKQTDIDAQSFEKDSEDPDC